MTLLAALLGFIVPIASPTPPDECHTLICHHRVAHRQRDTAWRRIVSPYQGWLARVRRCESGGVYTTNTGNGFYGAYQFTVSSWRAVGGWGMPHLARPLEQDYRAVRLLGLQGRGAWPVCG
jgi:hypothetical protein